MGYTTYFPQQRAFTKLEWLNLLASADLIIKETKVPLVGYEDEPDSKPVLNENQIRFNGVGSDGYETFMITKNRNKEFNFCKTAEKPYDEVVCAVLLACHHTAPGVLEISSDGRWNEWQLGVKLATKAIGELNFECPNDNSRVELK